MFAETETTLWNCVLSEKLGAAVLQEQVEFQKSRPRIPGRAAAQGRQV